VPAQEFHVDALYARKDLAKMLAQADFICLICPHTPETEGMIDREAFAAMKPEAVLINIGRGALVDEAALIDALANKRIQGAVLDVAAEEPLVPDHPLWEMDNVIIFPHSASTSKNENRRLTDLFCHNLDRFLKGQELKNVFDIERLY
jgi:phosphoglycerate dehydrogenase-like enzyme